MRFPIYQSAFVSYWWLLYSPKRRIGTDLSVNTQWYKLKQLLNFRYNCESTKTDQWLYYVLKTIQMCARQEVKKLKVLVKMPKDTLFWHCGFLSHACQQVITCFHVCVVYWQFNKMNILQLLNYKTSFFTQQ